MYTSKLANEETDRLFDAVLSLRDREECYRFFEDLCTINEVKSMAQRLDVARRLRAGEVYSRVAEDTGASTATISRVNRCLHYGADGYRNVLARLEDRPD